MPVISYESVSQELITSCLELCQKVSQLKSWLADNDSSDGIDISHCLLFDTCLVVQAMKLAYLDGADQMASIDLFK